MSRIWISENAYEEMKDALAAEGHVIAPVRPCEAVSRPINAHPDIFLCKLGAEPKSPVFRGDALKLGPKYPEDVPYNAVVTESFLICNTKTVSSELADAARALYPDIVMIHVPQGYTKCNMVVVDERHFITEDQGIYKAIEEYNAGLLSKTDASEYFSGSNLHKAESPDCKAVTADKRAECLLVRPGFVELPGYGRGFIGGASGRIGSEIWFNGDISLHPDFDAVNDFINSCGLKLRYLSGKELVDIGSIIEECDD